MRVRAVTQGFYLGRHIDPGTVFEVDPEYYAGVDDPNPQKAKFGWMEKADKDDKLSSDSNITKPPKKKSFVERILGN